MFFSLMFLNKSSISYKKKKKKERDSPISVPSMYPSNMIYNIYWIFHAWWVSKALDRNQASIPKMFLSGMV